VDTAKVPEAEKTADPQKPIPECCIRVCWSGAPDPEPGALIVSTKGKMIYQVLAVEHLHRAMLSARPRLKIIVQPFLTSECSPEDVNSALPWAHTGRQASPCTTKPPEAPAAAKANRKARKRQDHRAAELAKALKANSDTKNALVEKVRLPKANAGDDTPRSAGEVEMGEWDCPIDTADPDRPKTTPPKKIKGYRTADVLVRMSRRAGSQITPEFIRAANKLRLAYDVARLGYGSGNAYEPSGGDASNPMPKTSHGAAAEARVEKAKQFARACRVVGASHHRMLMEVVIGNTDIATWCRVRKKAQPDMTWNPEVEMGKLIGILMTLSDFYRIAIAFDDFFGNVA
jgi:hypothetical protein